MTARRSIVRLAIGLALFATAPALAQSREAEAAARDALRKAQLDAMTQSYDSAVSRLRTAEAGCGATRCSKATRAAVARDLGVMLRNAGDEGGSSRAFAEALTIDPKIQLPREYDTAENRSAWQIAREQATGVTAGPPDGDFVHTPIAEQRVDTPVPVYVEYRGEMQVTSVVVKYRGERDHDFKAIPLRKLGRGWGGVLPCAAATNGVVRYFLQGFEPHGSPIALSGSLKRPYVVPIRASLVGAAPSLPGEPPPAQCGANGTPQAAATMAASDARECSDDSACGAGKCETGRCVDASTGEPEHHGFRRLWIGVAGSAELTTMGEGTDVCKLDASAAAQSGFYCTTPAGANLPSRAARAQNDALVAGKSGSVGAGPVAGNPRVLLAVDLAVTANALLGARVGYVVDNNPGAAPANDGRAFKRPFHAEVRLTYLFGDGPLDRTGFAPLLSLGAGAGAFSASKTSEVTLTGIPGKTPVDVWKTGGPWFAGIGAGVRYAFSPRAAFTSEIVLRGAFGGAGFYPTAAPELAVQYGF